MLEKKSAGISAERPEELTEERLSEFLVDIIHRISVHHTLWFREVEHQLGFEKAMEIMDEAWTKIRAIAAGRLAEEFGWAEEDGIYGPLGRMSSGQKLKLIDMLAKDWLAQDGVWFQAVEKRHGMNDAKRCNDSTWGRFSPFEAHSIKKLLGLGEQPGLEGLEKALNFRIYGRLNVQSSHYEDDALIFEMKDCRVQSARRRKNMPDYPCKSAGLVEYSYFASAVDERIKTECICCPPDEHPEESYCVWRFTLSR